MLGDELIGHRDLQRTGYYADFARHYDMVRALVGVVEVDASSLSVVTISGSERRGGFGQRDVDLLEPLVPHIRRAVRLHRRIIEANRMATDFAEALERLSQAVLLVDATGQVRFSNRAAGQLLALRDGLSIDDGELRTASASHMARLRVLLGDAIAASRGVIAPAGGVLTVRRPSGARSFIVSVSPAGQRYAALTADEAPAAVVFVSDQAPVTDPDALRSMFGLTPAERPGCASRARRRAAASRASSRRRIRIGRQISCACS